MRAAEIGEAPDRFGEFEELGEDGVDDLEDEEDNEYEYEYEDGDEDGDEDEYDSDDDVDEEDSLVNEELNEMEGVKELSDIMGGAHAGLRSSLRLTLSNLRRNGYSDGQSSFHNSFAFGTGTGTGAHGTTDFWGSRNSRNNYSAHSDRTEETRAGSELLRENTQERKAMYTLGSYSQLQSDLPHAEVMNMVTVAEYLLASGQVALAETFMKESNVMERLEETTLRGKLKRLRDMKESLEETSNLSGARNGISSQHRNGAMNGAAASSSSSNGFHLNTDMTFTNPNGSHAKSTKLHKSRSHNEPWPSERNGKAFKIDTERVGKAELADGNEIFKPHTDTDQRYAYADGSSSSTKQNSRKHQKGPYLSRELEAENSVLKGEDEDEHEDEREDEREEALEWKYNSVATSKSRRKDKGTHEMQHLASKSSRKHRGIYYGSYNNISDSSASRKAKVNRTTHIGKNGRSNRMKYMKAKSSSAEDKQPPRTNLRDLGATFEDEEQELLVSSIKSRLKKLREQSRGEDRERVRKAFYAGDMDLVCRFLDDIDKNILKRDEVLAYDLRILQFIELLLQYDGGSSSSSSSPLDGSNSAQSKRSTPSNSPTKGPAKEQEHEQVQVQEQHQHQHQHQYQQRSNDSAPKTPTPKRGKNAEKRKKEDSSCLESSENVREVFNFAQRQLAAGCAGDVDRIERFEEAVSLLALGFVNSDSYLLSPEFRDSLLERVNRGILKSVDVRPPQTALERSLKLYISKLRNQQKPVNDSGEGTGISSFFLRQFSTQPHQQQQQQQQQEEERQSHAQQMGAYGTSIDEQAYELGDMAAKQVRIWSDQ